MAWDKYFFNLVDAVALKSKDPSSQIGAVIVNPESNAILSTGWNGFPRGVGDSIIRYEDRDTKYKLIVHAEQNAILNAARNGIKLEGSMLYVSFHPCHVCAASIIQCGIKEVKYKYNKEVEKRWGESFNIADTLFLEANIKVLSYV